MNKETNNNNNNNNNTRLGRQGDPRGNVQEI